MVAQLRFAHKWRLINDSSQEIGKFVDIEGFWRLYNHLPALQPTGAHLGFRINGKPVVSISLFRLVQAHRNDEQSYIKSIYLYPLTVNSPQDHTYH